MRVKKVRPRPIWSALDVLKVERIDHGVQSVKDPTWSPVWYANGCR